MRIVALVAACLCLLGCSAIDKVSDQDLADNIKMGAEAAAKHGLKYAIAKSPEKADEIREGAEIAVKAIRTTVLPMFQGAGTEEVLRNSVDLALAELSSQLTPTVQSAIQLSLNILASEVKLPDNPTAKLDARTRLALAGLFEGTADGLEAGSSKTAAKAGIGLRWPQ